MDWKLVLGVGALAVVIEHFVKKLVAPIKEHWPKLPWDLITPVVALACSVVVGMKAQLNVFAFIGGLADWSGVALTSVLLWFGAEGIYEVLKQLTDWAGKVSALLQALADLKRREADELPAYQMSLDELRARLEDDG